ncbi:MAG TPA: type II toxin-antitoxin system VapC family toxin [Candidatus Lokiarchaeia archaeon]|nr:type II toxin-antitoxin system VapC family toxin [Candidatus Lokiarchaeia archaeon]
MICLDSDILIGHLRQNSDALKFIQEHESEGLVTTIITKFELLIGAKISKKRVGNLTKVRDLIARLPSLDFSSEEIEECSDIYSELQNAGTMVDMRDIFIGGSCRRFKVPLATRNLDHFNRIDGLEVIQW